MGAFSPIFGQKFEDGRIGRLRNGEILEILGGTVDRDEIFVTLWVTETVVG